MTRLCAIACAVFIAAPAAAQEGLSVRELMTPREFQAAGLGKLTPAELAALNAWLGKFAQAVMDLSSEPDAAPRSVPQTRSPQTIDAVLGGTIIAEDGQLLGKVVSCLSTDSFCNDFGTYGSEYSSKSIWNEFGQYGSEFSSKSPFNEFTSTPPRIFLRGEFVAYLTVNEALSPRIHPHALRAALK